MSQQFEIDDQARVAARARADDWWAANSPPVTVTPVLGCDDIERLQVLGYMRGDR